LIAFSTKGSQRGGKEPRVTLKLESMTDSGGLALATCREWRPNRARKGAVRQQAQLGLTGVPRSL